MQMDAECVPCLLGRVLFETNLCAPERSGRIMRDCVKILGERFEAGANSAEVATAVHRRAYDLLCPDPYADLKRRSNIAAQSLYAEAMEFVEGAEDRLEAACLCAIAGNVLDFGIGASLGEPEELGKEFDRLVGQGLDVNEVPKMRRILEEAEEVVLLLDNCGEVVFDKLLVAELRSFGVGVTGVAKGEAILTDVTEADAHEVGIDKMFDETLTTGSFAIGIDLSRIGDRLRSKLENA
ncbi:MAG: DUF89 family protein, partial [Euryarchaeota archaeon]|nr:DUF89 family protein [Euryarchaeota archaeon]